MTTVQVQLPSEVISKLELIALERGISTEQIVVELLDQSTDRIVSQITQRKEFPDWIGSATSGIPDLGVNVDDYLFKTLTPK